MDDQKILNMTLDRLPTGRAFQHPLLQAFIAGSQNLNVQIINDIENDAVICNNINLNYADWLKLLIRLPHTQEPKSQCENVLIKLASAGAMSLSYMQEQLNLAGFDVAVSANYPAKNPFTYFNKTVATLIENTTHAIEGDQLAIERDKAEIDLIVNYLDNRDNLYNNQYFITQNPNIWHNCFFIHGKGGIDTPATIDKDKRQKFKELVIELKDLQSFALAYVYYS